MRTGTISFLAILSLLSVGIGNSSAVLAKPATKKVKKKGHLVSWNWKDKKVKVWIKGQYRPRFEFTQNKDLKSPDKGGSKDRGFVSHRARLGVGIDFADSIGIFIQLQDVRLWGSEIDTLKDFSADYFDLHQGYLLARWKGFFVKAGRMEMWYDNHRLIGTVGWTPQARAFDGVVTGYEHELFRLHLLYATLREMGPPANDSQLSGLWFHFKKFKFFKPSFYFLLDHRWSPGGLPQSTGTTPKPTGEKDLTRITTGLFSKGGFGDFKYTLEFFAQFGSQKLGNKSKGLFAYMLAVSANYKIPVATSPTIRLAAELLSGDDDPTDDTIKSFDTLFATNHKFYGWMDFFLNIPVHTKGAGLMDFIGSIKLSPFKGAFIRLDYHYFRLFVPRKDKDGNDQQELGHEFDLILGYKMLKGHLKFLAGFSILLPGPAFGALGKGDSPEMWSFFQADASF